MINRLISQRYEVLEKIGESPLFQVYRARDRVLNRVVVLKTVTSDYANDTAFMQGLQNGLAVAANLNHPNITTFYEFGFDEGVPYAVVEFVRGINLKVRIRRIAPFTLSAAVDIACEIGEALHCAHSLNQVHGDLRPQNVITSPEGAVKVTDFGVMVGVARSSQAQRATLLQAAPYHAPELSTTQPGSPSGDVYALGAVLYEMLTGTPVYAGESPEVIADLHAFAPIPSPRTLNLGIPRSIEGIIVKCLQKRPEQRYASATDLLNDLKAVRDALRFGKPLSWSPIEVDSPTPSRTTTGAEPTTSRSREPVAAATSTRANAMPAANNRLRARDERVSVVIKAAIGVVTTIIVLCLFAFFIIYRLDWSVPAPVTIPQMIDRPLDDVKADADKLHVHLILHGEYINKPRNLVFKTDQPQGVQIRPGHSINVWYSLGPEYVDVPNVVGTAIEDAKQKLQSAGLTVGKVMPEFSNTVPQSVVISQNVSFRKRVLHDTVVDLIFSDGKKPDFAQNGSDSSGSDSSTDSSNTDNPTTDTAGTDNATNLPNGSDNGSGQTNLNSPSYTTEFHHFSRNINITHTPEGKNGACQVRIEYEDETGATHPLVDDQHREGEKLPIDFDYFGKEITLRIFYDDKVVFEKKFDPQKTKGRIAGDKP